MEYNCNTQYYKGLPIRLINREDYRRKNAKRFVINDTNQNVWIPNRHLQGDGTIKEDEDIDYIFVKAGRQLELAGYQLWFKPIGG
ncbi:hypothetical protein [Bacillus licheniformis]|mgnify:CR=1 FL=1|uniref:hypothetical protein n=1 Tax=Bacillus licheniformis TaxID=1402 RepID=UPI000E472ECD|nr:hypothetical protein [Bacillus licheniformis]MCB4338860.1 hypothetical protein [Bacillus subtilis]MCB5337255.1 hypothetical protein [Bacillus amyloliquefaciens]RHL12222.1 hypothetical protein DW032_18440 [Bacillus licheniformis]